MNKLFQTIIVIFLFTSFSLNGQNYVVHYSNYKKIEDQKYSSFLIYNKQNSISIDIFHSDEDRFEELTKDQDFQTSKKYIRNIMKEDIFSNTYFGVSSLPGVQIVIYKDTLASQDWTIVDGEKEILGMVCKRAKRNFRGREYDVWFTTEIPVPIGPWKLGGLPGIILKADVDQGLYTFAATRLSQISDDNIPERYSNIYTKNQDKIIEFKKFIELETALFLRMREQHIAELPKGTLLTEVPPIRDTFIEKVLDFDYKYNKQ